MRSVSVDELNPESLKRLLSGVPFFNELMRQNGQQFDALVTELSFSSALPDEVVVTEGEVSAGVYFLLRGELNVIGQKGADFLYQISPGEIFGAISLLRGTPRTATLKVPSTCKEVLLARLDYDLFANTQDNSYISMSTKLSFYRMLVHHIRWALESRRMQDPNHPVVSKLLKLPLFHGQRNSREELDFLCSQSNRQADLLCQWNTSDLV